MKFPTKGIAIVLLLLAIMAVLYIIKVQVLTPPEAIRSAQAGELNEYQGVRLSSIGDFRENSIHGPQHVDINTYRLNVTGMVRSPQSLTYGEILDNFTGQRKVATLNCVEGWSVTILWDGVPVRDILAAAGPEPGATTAIFYAADGYSTSFPLSYLEDNDIIMAYAMNNVTMPAERGYPFQLVAEGKWGYKWIKWVTGIELTNQSYYGYWESRGYSNAGDLNGSFIG